MAPPFESSSFLECEIAGVCLRPSTWPHHLSAAIIFRVMAHSRRVRLWVWVGGVEGTISAVTRSSARGTVQGNWVKQGSVGIETRRQQGDRGQAGTLPFRSLGSPQVSACSVGSHVSEGQSLKNLPLTPHFCLLRGHEITHQVHLKTLSHWLSSL